MALCEVSANIDKLFIYNPCFLVSEGRDLSCLILMGLKMILQRCLVIAWTFHDTNFFYWPINVLLKEMLNRPIIEWIQCNCGIIISTVNMLCSLFPIKKSYDKWQALRRLACRHGHQPCLDQYRVVIGHVRSSHIDYILRLSRYFP